MKLLEQNHIKYALIMSAVVVGCLVIMEVTGQNKTFDQSPIAHFFTMIAPIVVWFFGIRAKKKLQKGKLTYKQGLMEGFKIALVYGLISPFIFLFYYLFINPEILNAVRTVYQLNGATNEMVIGVDMFAQFLAAIIGGTIYGAIISLFLKTKTSKK